MPKEKIISGVIYLRHLSNTMSDDELLNLGEKMVQVCKSEYSMYNVDIDLNINQEGAVNSFLYISTIPDNENYSFEEKDVLDMLYNKAIEMV